MAGADSLRPGRLRGSYLWIALAGVGVRFLFLWLAGDLEPWADESRYLYLAATLLHFGFLGDFADYIWPPLYPWFLSQSLALFGVDGIFVAKLVQVLAAGVEGLFTMRIADLLFGGRAGRMAGIVWLAYLPLVGYTHYLWPETLFLALFLPALFAVFRWYASPSEGHELLLAGLLYGVSLLLKEVGLYLAVALTLLLFWRGAKTSVAFGLRHALAFLLPVIAVVLPWSLRNLEVYGRSVPVGSTLGENCLKGILRPYNNLDLARITLAEATEMGVDRPPALVEYEEPDEVIQRSKAIHVLDRSAEYVRLAADRAGEQPLEFAATRLRHVVDFLSPMSFFVRHFGLHRYKEPLSLDSVRRVLVAAALLQSAVVLLLAMAALPLRLKHASAGAPLALVLAYFLLPAMLVGMSRYRVPIEPLLFALAAGLVAPARGSIVGSSSRASRIAAAALVLALLCAWIFALDRTWTYVAYLW